VKKFLIFLYLLPISLFAQHAADKYLDITYEGYVNGQYVFKLVSLQDCKQKNPNFNFSIVYQNVTITSVSPANNGNTTYYNTIEGQEQVFYFTGAFSPTAKFVFQALTQCDWKGESPQAITINTTTTGSLPVKFVNAPKVTHVYEDYVTVEFQVAEESQIKFYNVEFSRDNGKTWEIVAVQMPNNLQSNKTYSLTVKLNK
jgi:hypothetical protein